MMLLRFSMRARAHLFPLFFLSQRYHHRVYFRFANLNALDDSSLDVHAEPSN